MEPFLIPAAVNEVLGYIMKYRITECKKGTSASSRDGVCVVSVFRGSHARLALELLLLIRYWRLCPPCTLCLSKHRWIFAAD